MITIVFHVIVNGVMIDYYVLFTMLMKFIGFF